MSGPGILPIVECGDPVLRLPAEPVDPSDLRTSEMQVLIARMRVTMEAAPGVGLAAPQVGVPVPVFSGWAARIVQHEVDHVRGRLYLDRVELRSLSTLGSYARLWAGRPTEDAAASLGFTLQ